MEGLRPGEKVIGVYQLVPLPANTTAATASEFGAANDATMMLPLTGVDGSDDNRYGHIQTVDQTYLVLPVTCGAFETAVPCPMAAAPSAPTAMASMDEAAPTAAVSHSCNFCTAQFSDVTVSEFLAHHRREHSTNSGERHTTAMCVVCNHMFTSEIHLEFHMTAEHKGCRPFKCEFCERKYANTTSLDVHILEEHPNKLKPYACTSCMASFAIKTELVAHLRNEHRQKYVCQFCVKHFRNAGQLKRHERTHTGSPMQIGYVPALREEPTSAAELIAMVANDVSEMNALPVVGELSTENQAKTDEKEAEPEEEDDGPTNIPIPNVFRCPLCDETFLERSNQSTHLLIHSDEGPFECPDCGCLFQDIEMFQMHVLEHDENAIQMQLDRLQQDAEAIGIINYDDLHHSIDSLLNNAEFHDFDEYQNYDEIITTLKGPAAEERPPAAIAAKDIVEKAESNILPSSCGDPALAVAGRHPAQDSATIAASSADRTPASSPEDPLESNEPPLLAHEQSSIQRNKRPPVSVAWQQRDSKTRNFECTQCQRSFTLARTLALHRRRTHLGIKPYECSHCGWKFAQSSDLTKHTRTHSGQKPYTCDYCQSSFALKRNLRTHMKIHTKDPSACPHCERTFRIEENLTCHLKKHEGANAVKCTECGIPYVSGRDMDIHMRQRHFQPTEKKCAVCGRAFERFYDLRMHMVVHTGERPFKCSQCAKTFTQATSLRNHMLGIHSTERQFQCDECGKHFAFLGNLKTHIRTHANVRHFGCNICAKTFARHSSLMEHRRIHLGVKAYKCDQCDKAFINSSAYAKHKRIHTDQRPHRCHVCDRHFRQKSHLAKHLLTHTKEKPFRCSDCGKLFQRADVLANHLSAHVKQRTPAKVDDAETAAMHQLRPIRPKTENVVVSADVANAAHLQVHFCGQREISNPQIVYTFTASDLVNLSGGDVYQPMMQIEPLAGDDNDACA